MAPNEEKALRGLVYAILMVFMTLLSILIFGFMINWLIAPVLVSASNKLMLVDWQAMGNLTTVMFDITIAYLILAVSLRIARRRPETTIKEESRPQPLAEG